MERRVVKVVQEHKTKTSMSKKKKNKDAFTLQLLKKEAKDTKIAQKLEKNSL